MHYELHTSSRSDPVANDLEVQLMGLLGDLKIAWNPGPPAPTPGKYNSVGDPLRLPKFIWGLAKRAFGTIFHVPATTFALAVIWGKLSADDEYRDFGLYEFAGLVLVAIGIVNLGISARGGS